MSLWVSMIRNELIRNELDRNSDKKCGAFIYFGIEPNASAVFLGNDVVANGKSLAGSLANLFGGVEGVEDAGAGGQRDTGPIVLDFDLNIVVDLPRSNDELSVFAALLGRGVTDGVGSVDNQVQKDLIHLVAVALDARQVGLIIGLNVGEVLDLILCNGEGCIERFVEIDVLSFSAASVGKAPNRPENLAHAPDPLKGLGDGLGNLAPKPIPIFGRPSGRNGWGRVRVGGNRGVGRSQAKGDSCINLFPGVAEKCDVIRNILDGRVEFMGNTGSQLSDGGEFLSLLRHATIADVASGNDECLDLAAGVTNETAMRFQADVGTILSLHAIFDNLANTSLESLLGGPSHHRPVVGMDLLEGNRLLQFFFGIAEETLIRRVVVDAVSALVDHGDQIGTVLGDGTKQLFGAAMRSFDFLAGSGFGDEILV